MNQPKLPAYFQQQVDAAQFPQRPPEVAAQLGERKFADDLTGKFLDYWNLVADKSLPVPEREYRFCTRRWRFDLCWPLPIGVAVEFDGGTYSQGKHSRGKGQSNDADKSNEAQAMGYLVLRFTADHLRSKRIVETINTVQHVVRWRTPGDARIVGLVSGK